MAGSEAMNSWARIREGANDVEKLIGKKQYNMAMIKARQTLEFMVQCLAQKYGIEGTGDLSTAIDKLYQNGAIDRKSADHYHLIRQLGNRAAHEGDDKPSNATQAYHLLSQELYTFANDFSSRRVHRHNNAQSKGKSANTARQSKQARPAISATTIFKIIIVILAIVLVVAVIRFIGKKNDEPVEVETEMQVTVAETAAPEPIETMPETEPTEAPKIYAITGDGVRVRSTPTTEEDNILGTLATG